MSRKPAPVIPERLRKRFAPWPASRIPEETRQIGLRGIEAARAELARHRQTRIGPRPAAETTDSVQDVDEKVAATTVAR